MSHATATILIIDNDEAMLAALTTRFESLGYVCVTACTGAQGLAAFNASDIDLVITDVNMPAGDGVTVTREIRRLADTPIIICTGFRDEFWPQIHTLPRVSVVRKPCETSELVELVETELIMAGQQAPVAE